MSIYQEFIRRSHEPLVSDDEFDRFINAIIVIFLNADDVFDWIQKENNVPPSIRQMLLDLLSIPAMSAELERVFSSAKLTSHYTRNNLVRDRKRDPTSRQGFGPRANKTNRPRRSRDAKESALSALQALSDLDRAQRAPRAGQSTTEHTHQILLYKPPRWTSNSDTVVNFVY
jgi:hypothetical protein